RHWQGNQGYVARSLGLTRGSVRKEMRSRGIAMERSVGRGDDHPDYSLSGARRRSDNRTSVSGSLTFVPIGSVTRGTILALWHRTCITRRRLAVHPRPELGMPLPCAAPAQSMGSMKPTSSLFLGTWTSPVPTAAVP